jgi:hypothetical protein
MQNYLLYDASNSNDNANECRYALLKLLSVYNLKPPQNLSVIVHTGEPRLFDDFQTFYTDLHIKEPLSGVPHRKMLLIQDFFSTREGNLLICDTFTYPIRPLDDLFREVERNSILLFKKEHSKTTGQSSILKQIQAALSKYQHRLDDLPQKVEDVSILDSAIIGLNQSMLSEVKFAGDMTNRIFNQITDPLAEKFAISYAFHKHSPFKTANDYFADYFELTEFRLLLRTFFSKNEEESIPNLVKLSSHLDAAAIKKEKAIHKELPLLKRWWKELTGKGWSIRKYERKIS